MTSPTMLSLRLLGVVAVLGAAWGLRSAETVYSWVQLDYTWRSAAERQHAIETGQYVVRNNVITGVKTYLNEAFVTVPRWVPGVPSTLNRVSQQPGNLLEPFPSWEMNKEGDCSALQHVQSMEVVPQTGEMWIIDTGHRWFFTPTPDLSCNAKLWIVHLRTGRVRLRYEFPADVVSRQKSFLNDIVVDPERNFAYISNPYEMSIVVFDRNGMTSHKVHHRTMRYEDNGQAFLVNGLYYNNTGSVDGICLTPDRQTVYFTPFNGFMVYQVPTATLRKPMVTQAELDSAIQPLLRKGSQTDGMYCDSRGRLYWGPVALDTIMRWTPASVGEDSKIEYVCKSDEDIFFVDTFHLDERQRLWFSTNKLPAVTSGHTSWAPDGPPNFRLWRVPVDADSYIVHQHTG